ncbi:competence/damage-inducible protein A [Euzebya tangerina]|uniref:competence/damage-inducible protein A n=1 Tax=Euzebya tangerina TaxID=591198 RepID=UPI000E30BBCF|nr:molybdopterin-binding protein [Euzebya tangerina]
MLVDMTAAIAASIIVIGDEILGGFVQDTNSHWLATRLQTLGVPLDRVQTIPDTMEAIDEGVSMELERGGPRLIMTTGGIGSTPDDLTLEGVAATIGRSVVVDAEIDGRITAALEWTAEQGATVTPDHERSMRRMARVPEGAYLLAGARGVAPGVAVDLDGGVRKGGTTIVILPGIPSEMKRIFDSGIVPELLDGLGVPQHVVELTHEYPESTLNPLFDRLVEEYPEVHLGSYPGLPCIVRLKGTRDQVEAAEAVTRTYLDELDADPASARLRKAWAARWTS